jgi:site-specific recombinase XerD
MRPKATAASVVRDLSALVPSFERSLRAANKSPKTIKAYVEWLEEAGEVRTSPMAKMKPPKVPEQHVPVLSDDELRALLKACDGRDFEERR